MADARHTDAPPPGAKVRLERAGEGGRLTLLAEPLGVVRGSFGLSIFGPLIMLVGMTIYGRVAMLGEVDAAAAVISIALFLIGLLMGMIGIEMGTRRYRIEAGGDGLSVHRRSGLPGRAWQWPRESIVAIEVAQAPFNAAGRPVYRLHVIPRRGKALKLMTGRDQRELAWIADRLADALGLGEAAADDCGPSTKQPS